MKKINFFLYSLKRIKNYILNIISYNTSLELSKPVSVFFNYTKRCNLHCKHCDIWKDQTKKKELTLDEWKKTALELNKWLGDYVAAISGGEPLMRKDLFEFIEFLSKNTIDVTLTTNGFLIDTIMAEKIVKSNLNKILFSFYSLNPDVHNAIRGNKESHKKLIEGIKKIRDLCEFYKIKKELKLGVVITSTNIEELEEIILWAKQERLSVSLFALLSNFDADYEEDWKNKSTLWPKNKQLVKTVFDKLIYLKKENYPIANDLFYLKLLKQYYLTNKAPSNLNCKASVNNFVIDEVGNVSFCFLKLIGNVRTTSPKKIWNSKKAILERKKLAGCNKDCKVNLCHYEKPFLYKIKYFLEQLR